MYKKLDRIVGTQALIDGFVAIFGEKHRPLLETKGKELIELGLKNGKLWSESKVISGFDMAVFFDMGKKGLMDKEQVESINKDLPLFFTDIQIENIKTKDSNNNSRSYNYTTGVGDYVSLFVEKISDTDTKVTTAKAFNHFKEYIIYSRPKITLFGESGLGLDEYSFGNLKYYKEENELFYMIENIARKFHYFGMLLAKDLEMDFWIDKIKNNLTEDINYFIKSKLDNILSALSDNEKEVTNIILDIQKTTGVVEGFMTRKQLSESINKIRAEDLPDSLF